MRRFTGLLITVHVLESLCGRGPAVFGLAFALSIPIGLLLLLIGALYPGGLASFAWKTFRTVLEGFH
jgi:hypothetical protein